MVTSPAVPLFSPFLSRAGRAIDRLPRQIFTRWGQMMIDAGLSVTSVWLAYQFRFDFAVPAKHKILLWVWALSLSVLRPLCLMAAGVYRGIWRHFNLDDALLFGIGATPPTAFIFLARIVWPAPIWKVGLPLTVVIADYIAFLLLGLSVRGLRRFLYEASLKGSKRKRTLLLGSEDGLAAALRQAPLNPDIFITGLLTSDDRLLGSRINGFEVLGGLTSLPTQLLSGEIDLVLISDADPQAIGGAVETAVHFGVEVRLLPSAAKIISGDIRVSARPKAELAVTQPVTIAEQPHPSVLEAYGGKSVLITGAGGSIGSELARQVSRLPVSRLVLLDQDENAMFHIHGELSGKSNGDLFAIVGDIRDRNLIKSVFRAHGAQIVLHAAAYKHVPVMEYNCAEAVLNNVFGTRNIAEAALDSSAERFLMVSTDKAVNPSSMMGATKRMAELLVQNMAAKQDNGSVTRCACVRFGNVLGSAGSVVPIFLQQIANGGPVTITDAEMTRYFMTIPEAVHLILQASTIGSNGEIYMLDMGDPVKITELATRLIEMSGLRPGHDIEIKFVGTRPGEKLHEQLWTDATQVTPTSFPRILSVQPPSPADDFHHHLQLLEAAAFTREDEHVRKTMLGMPINYKPSEQQAAVVTMPHLIPARTLTMPAQTVHRPGTAASANA
jgi:FlaA1/EpsC-like NDP-sugar epimerase